MLVFLLLALLQVPAAVCTPASTQALQEAATLVGSAGAARGQRRLVDAAKNDRQCTELLGAGWSLSGWVAARAAVKAGGAPDSLVDARDAVQHLEKLGARPEWRVESEYARVAITAAMAAAQDERGEMQIYLAHARGLADRLALTGVTPRWPLPIDVLEGDLWLEVDRYDEARAAFQRARQRDASGFVLTGLGRTLARLGDPAACGVLREAMEKSEGALRDEAATHATRTCR